LQRDRPALTTVDPSLFLSCQQADSVYEHLRTSMDLGLAPRPPVGMSLSWQIGMFLPSNTTELGLADTCPQITRTTTTGTTGPALPPSLEAAFQLSSFGVNARGSVATDITHEVLQVTLKQLDRELRLACRSPRKLGEATSSIIIGRAAEVTSQETSGYHLVISASMRSVCQTNTDQVPWAAQNLHSHYPTVLRSGVLENWARQRRGSEGEIGI